jgi:uncharacterized protein
MRLKVRVIPNAKKTMFGERREDEWVLRLNAPAVEGKANRAAFEFISEEFGVQRSRVRLVSGEKSRHKVFEIADLDETVVEAKLHGRFR